MKKRFTLVKRSFSRFYRTCRMRSDTAGYISLCAETLSAYFYGIECGRSPGVDVRGERVIDLVLSDRAMPECYKVQVVEDQGRPGQYSLYVSMPDDEDNKLYITHILTPAAETAMALFGSTFYARVEL